MWPSAPVDRMGPLSYGPYAMQLTFAAWARTSERHFGVPSVHSISKPSPCSDQADTKMNPCAAGVFCDATAAQREAGRQTPSKARILPKPGVAATSMVCKAFRLRISQTPTVRSRAPTEYKQTLSQSIPPTPPAWISLLTSPWEGSALFHTKHSPWSSADTTLVGLTAIQLTCCWWRLPEDPSSRTTWCQLSTASGLLSSCVLRSQTRSTALFWSCHANGSSPAFALPELAMGTALKTAATSLVDSELLQKLSAVKDSPGSAI
mmetsp:Transcript_22862/g.50158  ORF Transcript_22862/g.50158 Transcript_22862/m.50158 type:complete len:263 (+) Transcript_22862:284-1072(+)